MMIYEFHLIHRLPFHYLEKALFNGFLSNTTQNKQENLQNGGKVKE
jgi:hypothetical protein